MPKITSHHEGRYLSLREIDDWEFSTRPNATGVVGPMQARVLEICAGLIGDEEEFADEKIIDCAQRELLEETGYTPGKIIHLLSSPTSAGMTDEMTHLFLATDCVKTASGGGVAGEDITTHLVPQGELQKFFQESEKRGLLIDFKIHACLGAMELLKNS